MTSALWTTKLVFFIFPTFYFFFQESIRKITSLHAGKVYDWCLGVQGCDAVSMTWAFEKARRYPTLFSFICRLCIGIHPAPIWKDIKVVKNRLFGVDVRAT